MTVVSALMIFLFFLLITYILLIVILFIWAMEWHRSVPKWFKTHLGSRDPKARDWEERLRSEGADEKDVKWMAKACVERGLPIDFELPYPEPRNEYEDAWNDIHVNPVVSGRSD